MAAADSGLLSELDQSWTKDLALRVPGPISSDATASSCFLLRNEIKLTAALRGSGYLTAVAKRHHPLGLLFSPS